MTFTKFLVSFFVCTILVLSSNTAFAFFNDLQKLQKQMEQMQKDLQGGKVPGVPAINPSGNSGTQNFNTSNSAPSSGGICGGVPLLRRLIVCADLNLLKGERTRIAYLSHYQNQIFKFYSLIFNSR